MSAIAAGVLVAALILVGCTSTTIADPTATTTAISSQVTTTVQSSASPSTSSPPTSSSAPPTTASSNPWPADLTADQVEQAQAAITTYEGYIKFVDQAFTDPAQDWSAEAVKWATDPEKSNLLSNLAGTAALGQYTDGAISVEPIVTRVEPGVVTMTVCVDATDTGFYDKSGASIKAPNAPGTYFRHLSEVTVAKFQGDQWLVYNIVDDYNTTC